MSLVLTVYSMPIHLAGVTLAGYWQGLSHGGTPPGLSLSMLVGPPRRQVYSPVAGSSIAPAPLSVSWSYVAADSDSVEAIQRAAGPEVIAAVLPVVVVEALPSDEYTGTTWTLARGIGYSTVTNSRTLAPPSAWLDGVEQTVLDTGTPSAGQVVIPDSGSTITTPASLGGSVLTVLYLPLLSGVLSYTADHTQFNDVLYSMTFDETA